MTVAYRTPTPTVIGLVRGLAAARLAAVGWVAVALIADAWCWPAGELFGVRQSLVGALPLVAALSAAVAIGPAATLVGAGLGGMRAVAALVNDSTLRGGRITSVMAGVVFSPALAALVLAEFRRLSKLAGPTPTLSDREREVLREVATGATYAQIGRALVISPRTAEHHVRNILGQLQLSRRSDLVRYAERHGLG